MDEISVTVLLKLIATSGRKLVDIGLFDGIDGIFPSGKMVFGWTRLCQPFSDYVEIVLFLDGVELLWSSSVSFNEFGCMQFHVQRCNLIVNCSNVLHEFFVTEKNVVNIITNVNVLFMKGEEK